MEFHQYLALASLEGLVSAAVLALTALGLSLVFGVLRVVNVAHGAFFMLGAVLAWMITNFLKINPAFDFMIALILSPLIVAIIAFVADKLIIKNCKYAPDATMVATIGLLYILEQTALMIYGPDARPVNAPFSYNMQFAWFGYSAYKLSVIAAAIVILCAIWYIMSRTKLGLIMRMTAFDAETAQNFGINIGSVYSGVFALGAGLAAIGAVLIVPTQQAHYLMGGDPLLLSFIVVIIGGLGSLRGTILAAILIGMSDGIISVMFSPTLAKILSTILVMLVLAIRPQGILGMKAK